MRWVYTGTHVACAGKGGPRPAARPTPSPEASLRVERGSGAVGAAAILFYAFKPKPPRYTTIEMGADELTVAGKRYARSDIRNVTIQAHGEQVLTASNALALSTQAQLARLSATEQYAVDFDYGVARVRLVGELTAPLAERVGSEVAAWAGA